MDQLFNRYTISAASRETLAKVSYVIDLKEERLATSHEAFEYLKELRGSKSVRDIILDEYRKENTKNGWIPQLASVSRLGSLVLHLVPVVGYMAMDRNYHGPDSSVSEHSAGVRGSRLHLAITLPAHEDIFSQGVGFDRETGQLVPIKLFAPERSSNWMLTVASKITFSQCLSICCRAITELRKLDVDQLELSTSALGTLGDWKGESSSLSLQERTIQLGILLGLSRVPFLARITVGEQKGDCFELPPVDIFQAEQLKTALSHLNATQSKEVRNKTLELLLAQRSNYSLPLTTPWRVIFSRAQEIENTPEEMGVIKDRVLRRAVGLAYIETLPHYQITQNSRVESAIESVNSWLAAFNYLSTQDPRVLRQQTVRDILLEDRAYFEERIPALKN